MRFWKRIVQFFDNVLLPGKTNIPENTSTAELCRKETAKAERSIKDEVTVESPKDEAKIEPIRDESSRAEPDRERKKKTKTNPLPELPDLDHLSLYLWQAGVSKDDFRAWLRQNPCEAATLESFRRYEVAHFRIWGLLSPMTAVDPEVGPCHAGSLHWAPFHAVLPTESTRYERDAVARMNEYNHRTQNHIEDRHYEFPHRRYNDDVLHMEMDLHKMEAVESGPSYYTTLSEESIERNLHRMRRERWY